MNKYYFEGKTEEQAINTALEELKLSKEDLIVNSIEDKSSILKKNVKIEVLNMNEIITFIKDTLNQITDLMGSKSNLEVRRRDNNISVTIFSENNSILIGKNGKNVAALQLIIRQMVNSKLKEPLSIIIDVEACEIAHPCPVKAKSSITFLLSFISSSISSPQLGLCPISE